MEWNDIYDENRRLTGRIHRRGDPWKPGEYGLVVCAWVYDGNGNILMTRRAAAKSYAHTWENSGGAAQAGENSLQAIRRELFEETGIRAAAEQFEFLRTTRDNHFFYDHYCLQSCISLEQIVLQPEETEDARWVSFDGVHALIARGEICNIIAQQFLAEEPELKKRQNVQDHR